MSETRVKLKMMLDGPGVGEHGEIMSNECRTADFEKLQESNKLTPPDELDDHQSVDIKIGV